MRSFMFLLIASGKNAVKPKMRNTRFNLVIIYEALNIKNADTENM